MIAPLGLLKKSLNEINYYYHINIDLQTGLKGIEGLIKILIHNPVLIYYLIVLNVINPSVMKKNNFIRKFILFRCRSFFPQSNQFLK